MNFAIDLWGCGLSESSEATRWFHRSEGVGVACGHQVVDERVDDLVMVIPIAF